MMRDALWVAVVACSVGCAADGAGRDEGGGATDPGEVTIGETKGGPGESDTAPSTESESDTDGPGPGPGPGSASAESGSSGGPSCDGPDEDGDGVCDAEDNCPDVANPDQAVSEGNELGNACMWPNDESRASSDPWIAEHHDDLRRMAPRFLAINFANGIGLGGNDNVDGGPVDQAMLEAKALLQTVLPGDVRAAIDWTSLQRDDTELRAKHEASTRTDLLFRAKARVGDEHHEVMVLVVIEHQSTDDWTMPLRMLETMTGLWRRFLRERKQARSMPLIVPVLLSHTIGGWRTSRRLDEMFAVAPADLGLERYLPRLDLLLVDLTTTQRDELLAWAQSLVSRGAIAQGTMLVWLATSGETGDPIERVERALRHAALWLEMLSSRDPEQAELLLVYLGLTTKLTGPVLAAMLSAQGAPRAASTMSTLKEMWEAQQRERVFAEGEREGERQGKRKMLVKQLTLKFGDLGEHELQRIEEADATVLETYLERVLTADSITAVLGPE